MTSGWPEERDHRRSRVHRRTRPWDAGAGGIRMSPMLAVVDVHWPDVLRFIGAGFLICGVLCAAFGIRATRRDFSDRLGIMEQAMSRVAGALHDAFGGANTDQAQARSLADGAAALDFLSGPQGVAEPEPPVDASIDYRMTWLERLTVQMHVRVEQRAVEALDQRRAQDVLNSQMQQRVANLEERSEARVTRLAVEPLRLQAIGVALLLLGTVLTGFPDWIAHLLWGWQAR
jgi:hypothetical protein